jgi:hypothetical protein
VLGAACAFAGCFDFGKALSDCHAQGRCDDGGAPSNGGGAGGSAATGGGTSAGGGTATGGGVETVPFTGPGFCNDGGVCWEWPVPTGSDWESVYVAAPNDIWAVGTVGLMAHYDGTRFVPFDAQALTGAPPQLFLGFGLIRGFATDDIWLLGLGTPLLHYNGTSWLPVSLGGATATNPHQCFGVDGLAHDQVWVSCEEKLWLGSPSGLYEVVSDAGDCDWLLADDAGVSCVFTQSGSPSTILHVDGSHNVVDVTPADGASLRAGVRLSNGDVWVGGGNNGPYLAKRGTDGGFTSVAPPMNCTNSVVALAEETDGGVLLVCDDNGIVGLDSTTACSA